MAFCSNSGKSTFENNPTKKDGALCMGVKQSQIYFPLFLHMVCNIKNASFLGSGVSRGIRLGRTHTEREKQKHRGGEIGREGERLSKGRWKELDYRNEIPVSSFCIGLQDCY